MNMHWIVKLNLKGGQTQINQRGLTQNVHQDVAMLGNYELLHITRLSFSIFFLDKRRNALIPPSFGKTATLGNVIVSSYLRTIKNDFA